MGAKHSRLRKKKDAAKATVEAAEADMQRKGRDVQAAGVNHGTSSAIFQQEMAAPGFEQRTPAASFYDHTEAAAETYLPQNGRDVEAACVKQGTSSAGFQQRTLSAGFRKKTSAMDLKPWEAPVAAAVFRHERATLKQKEKGGPALRKSSALVVAAIDFGTTFSGYAFSFKNKPEQVLTFHWENGCIKTPTVLLLDPTRKFDSFGKKAEEKYMSLAREGTANKWYYFEKFKMQLYIKSQSQNQKLSRDMMIEDFNGKKLRALYVFSAAILYLKQHLLDFLNSRKENVIISLEDIHWVLTVPAIWTDSSKQFMREAAKEAGISDDLLTLALEPEAASIYCLKSVTLHQLSRNTTYMVLDIGGGTADITCHQILGDGSLREVYQACGGDYGGTMVDSEFLKLFRSIFGADIIAKYKDQHLDDYLFILQNFDRKKKYFDGSSQRNISIGIPAELIELYEEEIDESVFQSIRQHPNIGQFSLKHGSLCISSKLLQRFFDGAILNIQKEVESLLLKLPQISYILMVGGFSESPYLQKQMHIKFGDKIVTPLWPSEAVVKGAVIYGHSPDVISKRVCRYTYGIERMMRFKEGIHPTSKKVIVDGVEYVDNLFNKHITRGDVVEIGGYQKAQEYYPPGRGVRQVFLPVYASTETNPCFVDEEGCIYLGHVYAELTEFDLSADMKLLVKLIFSGTELTVEIREEKTGKIIQGYVDFLG